MRRGNSTRHESLRNQEMKALGRLLGRLAKLRGKVHQHPTMAGVVEQRPLRHRDTVLLLKTHRLSTELNLIRQPRPCRPALELDGKRDLWLSTLLMKLYRIGDAADAQALRDQRNRARHPNATPMIAARLIDPRMYDLSLHGGDVVLPYPLDVDQRRLPLAEHDVLQSRQRQESIDLAQ